MKIYLIGSLLFLFQHISCSLSAQVYTSGGKLEERIQTQLDELTGILTLSEEQKQLLKDILLKYGQLAQDKRNELGEAPRDSVRAVLMGLDSLKNEEVKAILTESQFADYLKFIEEQRLQRRERFRR
ncbi:MAG: hypothetical protein IPM92_06145 [Saprospiraceae bacterium]|nr:hypothetical protein [Saprospiraceae bacterium]